MRRAWLGKVEGTEAPAMFEAWASDRDFARPDVTAFSVRVLLTKNQLSDLQAPLRRIVEAGERAQIQPGRAEESRAGKERGSTCSSRWSRDHSNKKQTITQTTQK